jgi:hypothetical protein
MQPIAAVNADWRTSRSCSNGSCIEVATIDNLVGIRDSKNPDGEVLLYTVNEWKDFLAGAKNGDFDDLVS